MTHYGSLLDERLTEAAAVEFAQYGITRASIDRIAEAANDDPEKIKRNFGSNDGLFNAVYEVLFWQRLMRVTCYPHDLPDYAGRLYDAQIAHPEILRLSMWDLLERGGMASQRDTVVESTRAKLGVIEEAQRTGMISRRFSPQDILGTILSLTRTSALIATISNANPDEGRVQRQAIVDIIRFMVS